MRNSTPIPPSLHRDLRATLIKQGPCADHSPIYVCRPYHNLFRQHAENFLMCRPGTAAGKAAIGFMCWTITAFCLYVGGKFLYALLTGGYAS